MRVAAPEKMAAEQPERAALPASAARMRAQALAAVARAEWTRLPARVARPAWTRRRAPRAARRAAAGGSDGGTDTVAAGPRKKVIVFVWDGLRPDSVTMQPTRRTSTPQDQLGVDFQDNHSTYPTFTMMNSAAFATGSFPGHHRLLRQHPVRAGRDRRRAGGAAGLRRSGVHRGLRRCCRISTPTTCTNQRAPARQHALPGGAGARPDHGRRRQVGRGLLAGLPQGRLHRRREHGVPALACAQEIQVRGRRRCRRTTPFCPSRRASHARCGQRHPTASPARHRARRQGDARSDGRAAGAAVERNVYMMQTLPHATCCRRRPI